MVVVVVHLSQLDAQARPRSLCFHRQARGYSSCCSADELGVALGGQIVCVLPAHQRLRDLDGHRLGRGGGLPSSGGHLALLSVPSFPCATPLSYTHRELIQRPAARAPLAAARSHPGLLRT